MVSVVTRTRSFFSAADANFFEEIVDLAFYRTNLDLGIYQAGGPNHLFDDYATGFGQFVGAGSGGNVDDLVETVFEFFKGQRAVIEG